jgi:hypothetical protein
MSVALPGAFADLLRLEEITGGKRMPTPCQLAPGKPARLCWILSGSTPAGQKRVYELVRGDPAAATAVVATKDKTALTLKCGDTKYLSYHYAIMPPPEGQSPNYNRSGFIHPLWSPSQEVLTVIHPKDHIHHMGLWGPWTHSEFEGRPVDFWNLNAGQGTVRFAGFVSQADGPVFGEFQAKQEHVNLNAPGGEKVALNENLHVRVWSLGGPKAKAYVIDYVSTQRCASDSPLVLPKYRYGGFGYRARTDWKKENSDYLTSEGKTRKDGHSSRSRWCEVWGETDKGKVGILFLSHPENHEHPEPMRIWPENMYGGNIFFNYCPVQHQDWTLEPGKDYVFKYRMVVHDGEMSAKQAERIWQDFGNPPQVVLERN